LPDEIAQRPHQCTRVIKQRTNDLANERDGEHEHMQSLSQHTHDQTMHSDNKGAIQENEHLSTINLQQPQNTTTTTIKLNELFERRKIGRCHQTEKRARMTTERQQQTLEID